MSSIYDIPDEIVLYIFSFLPIDDIKRKTSESWKETYNDYYSQYGPYLHTENELLRTWSRLLKIVKSKLPIIYDSLLDGIDEESLGVMESAWQVRFPSSLKFLYQLCGGQDPISDAICSKPGNDTKCIKYLPIAKDYAHQIFVALPKTTKHAWTPDNCSPPPYTIVWTNLMQDRIFHVADSLQDWLREYTDRLSNGQYVIENGHVLRLEMKEDADPGDACQLMSRHWDIDQYVGNTTVREVVDGEGVVGQRPVMKPGFSKNGHCVALILNDVHLFTGVTFSWVSRTFFRKPGGSMSGYFTMRNLSTHVLSRVVCPRFTMPFPKEYLDSSEVES